MTRSRWLVAIILALLGINLTVHWWKNRGLITIHCEDWPATKVVHEIERQGGITVKSNLTDDIKIRMHVDRVPVSEAIETLTTVAEARWRLAYVFAGNMPEIEAALAATLAGNRPENWKTDYMPMQGIDGETLPDPREDLWQVKPAEKNDFQSYAHQAALSVSASMMYPEAWNPSVSKAPSSAPIHKSASQLAKVAGGKVLEVFLIQKRPQQAQIADGEDASATPQFGARRGGNRGNGTPEDDAERERRRQEMAQRAQAEVDKLPPEKRVAAQQRLDERRKFFESMRDLTPEQRKAKMEEFMSNDANQNRMEQRANDRNARMTPDQRVQRAQHYIERKQAAMAQMGK